ncbi:MAG: hypothetical protein IJZ37_06035 [Clostridia bacterium]|nr:hypothetical protein [Clostridia bacterium]
MKLRHLCAVVVAVLLLCLTTSCFHTDVNEPAVGSHDGIEYLFLEQQELLIISGEGVLSMENRICSLELWKDARYVYIAGGVTELEGEIFFWDKLEGVYSANTLYGLGDAVIDLVPFETEVSFERVEKGEDLPFGPIGHCPSAYSESCMLCGRECYYAYADGQVRFYYKGLRVMDETQVLEGKERVFDAEGNMQEDGFCFVGGSTRYFKDGRMTTGTLDLQGIRYSFSSNGSLSSARPLDTTVSPLHIILILLALPLGAGIAFGVYRIYLKSTKE